MPAGDLITLPWQAELNGVLMGPNTAFVLRGFEPWTAPVVRNVDIARAQQHGLFPGRDYLGERLVTADIAIRAATDALEQAARRQLAGAFVPPAGGLAELVWMEDDGVRYRLVGKPRMADSRVVSLLPTEARFIATDPRIYAATLTSLSTGLSAGSGGVTFPVVPPFVFGSAGAGSSIAATNAGTFQTPYVITFTGPLVAPVLVHQGQGRRLEFTGTLAAGETLVVDSDARTVLLNGTASRYSWLTSLSQWFTLEPGANPLQFGAGSGSGTCQIVYRSAWI
jgi:hypothetical protein